MRRGLNPLPVVDQQAPRRANTTFTNSDGSCLCYQAPCQSSIACSTTCALISTHLREHQSVCTNTGPFVSALDHSNRPVCLSAGGIVPSALSVISALAALLWPRSPWPLALTFAHLRQPLLSRACSCQFARASALLRPHRPVLLGISPHASRLGTAGTTLVALDRFGTDNIVSRRSGSVSTTGGTTSCPHSRHCT